MTDAPKPNWHDAFPAPRTIAPTIRREEILPTLSSGDLLLVDVRRTDYEGGTVKGSLNLPAHSFYMNRASLFDLCKRAGVRKVAFYCGKYCNSIHCFFLSSGSWRVNGVSITRYYKAHCPADCTVAKTRQVHQMAEVRAAQAGSRTTSPRRAMIKYSP
jgi:rhodanese-related sulfurtransferase